MTYDKKQVADRLCYWREFMQSFHLPTWEELPDLELYMDQVVSLVIEEEVQQIYTNFVHRYRTAYLRCVEQLEQLSEPVLDPGNQETSQVESLVLTTAVAATLYKLVTDKLLALQLPQEEPAH